MESISWGAIDRVKELEVRNCKLGMHLLGVWDKKLVYLCTTAPEFKAIPAKQKFTLCYHIHR